MKGENDEGERLIDGMTGMGWTSVPSTKRVYRMSQKICTVRKPYWNYFRFFKQFLRKKLFSRKFGRKFEYLNSYISQWKIIRLYDYILELFLMLISMWH